MSRFWTLGLHLALLVGLLALAAVVATFRGALWPFDPRFSLLVAGGGLAMLALGWGLVWLLPVAAAASLPRVWMRAALWPVAVLAMVALHAGFGLARGFVPLSELGLGSTLLLYAVPCAFALAIGSALRAAVRRRVTPPLQTP